MNKTLFVLIVLQASRRLCPKCPLETTDAVIQQIRANSLVVALRQ
jgi:hypothetical protein